MKRKNLLGGNCQLRAATGDGAEGHQIVGYAAMYNVRSNPIYYVRDSEGARRAVYEVLMPGAFDPADMTNVICCVNHDSTQMLGRTVSQTLRIKLDTIGLGYEVDVPDTTLGRDMGVLMGRGDYRENSFAFMVSESNINRRALENGDILEEVQKVDLVADVSIVTNGAYSEPFSVFREAGFTLENIVYRYSPVDDSSPNTRQEATQGELDAASSRQFDLNRGLVLARLETQRRTIEV